MKTYIKIITLCMSLLMACSHLAYSQTTVNENAIKPIEKQDKQSKKIKNKDLVSQQIASLMLKKQIRANMSNAVSTVRSTTNQEGYPISLIDGKFTCDLPFYGRGGQSAYGSGQDLYIKSTAQEVTNLTSSFNEKKGYYLINFTFKNEGEKESCTAVLKIFTSGKVSLALSSDRRTDMNYLGIIVL